MKKVLYNLFIILVPLIMPGMIWGAEYHGLVSMENYYSRDSSSAYDFNFLTTRTRLDVTKMNEAGSLSLHFDGRERNNLGSKDYSSNIKSERIDTLNLEYTGIERFSLLVGRLWPKESPTERVDGVNIVYQKTGLGAGIFGGLKPDPYTEEINSDFTSGGAYLFYRKEGLLANVALTHNGHKGATDRQYLYAQTSYSPVREIRVYGSVTADKNQETNDMDLTNAIAEVSLRPDFRRGVSIGYNQFQPYRLYSSMEFSIVQSRQQSYYISGDYRLFDRYTLYGRYERQMLEYQAFVPEARSSDIYHAGFRNDNLMGSDISTDIRGTFSNGYSSSYNSYSIEASRLFLEKLQIVLNGSYMQNRYELTDYTDDITSYGIAGYLALSRKWNISVSYDGVQARDYSTNTVTSRISARF